MEEKTLQKQAITSVIWKLFERFGAQLIQFVVGIVLARLLMPEDYGAIALISVFIAVSNVFTQGGFSTALIRKLDADDLDYSSVFWCSLLISVVLYLILFFTAPYIASFYNMPILKDVLRVLALVVIISTYNGMQNTILSKKLLFKKLFISSFSSVIVAGALGILCAYMGLGVWSLVVQQLASVTITTIVMCFTVKWHPKFIFSLTRLKSLFMFGWKLLCSALLDVVYNNLYSLIIGKQYASDDLAYWNRGKTFPDLLVGNISGSIGSVMYPVFSMEQNNLHNLKEAVRRTITVSSYIIFPMMVGLAVVAEPLIKLLLTDKWLPCVPFLQAWCIMYAFMPMQAANLQVYNALGRSDIFFGLEIVKKIIGIIVLFITLPYGLEIMILARIIVTLACLFINAFPNRKILKYSIWEQLKDIMPMILISATMGGVVYAISLISIHYVAVLVIQVIVGILVYWVLSALLKIDSYEYCKGLVIIAIDKLKNKKNNKNNENISKCDNNEIKNSNIVKIEQENVDKPNIKTKEDLNESLLTKLDSDTIKDIENKNN